MKKTKVKIFKSSTILETEKMCNAFLHENEVELIDIKVTMSVHMFVLVIAYK